MVVVAMTVYLVGAGPGDPGLLTVRGAEVLRQADVVLYDRLAAEALLDLAPADAERISVGKTPGHPSTPQNEINRLLVEKGKAGVTVVRLKGGDPFLFGRGGEEAQALADAGVAFEVVPGVPALASVPAYAGVPVTHRGLSKAVTVVTGQGDPWSAPETDWEAVARLGGTVVLYMAVANRAEIADRLLRAGMAATTPVLAVTNGTRTEQVVLRTTLAELGAADVRPPATIVIGAVAALDLAWFSP
jgi:uroporphyrinogen III methyltransferase/synthase